jgi:hypothetical protein
MKKQNRVTWLLVGLSSLAFGYIIVCLILEVVNVSTR